MTFIFFSWSGRAFLSCRESKEGGVGLCAGVSEVEIVGVRASLHSVALALLHLHAWTALVRACKIEQVGFTCSLYT